MDGRDRRNTALNTIGESLWGLMANLVAPATVLTVLLRDRGAGQIMVGSIAGIESSCVLLPQLLGIYVFHSRRHRKAHLVLWHLAAVLPFLGGMGLLTLFAASFPPRAYCLAMLACFGAFWFAIGIVVAAWTDFLGHLFTVEVRGKVMGLALLGFSLAGAGSTLFAGWLIAELSTGAFAWLYLLAWVVGMVSVCCWALVDDPGGRISTDTPRPRVATLVLRFRASLAEPNFRAFLASRVLATCGFCILPFVAVYYTDPAHGGLSREFVVSAYAAQTVGLGIGSLGLGWLGDRFGHRSGVLIGTAAQVAALGVVLTVPGAFGCVLVYAGAGVCAACGVVSHYNLILETCPHDNRMLHISAANLTVGIPLTAVPLLAGVAAAVWGLTAVFAASLALSLAALLVVVLRVREPRTLGVCPQPSGWRAQ
jgi:MFS family permease